MNHAEVATLLDWTRAHPQPSGHIIPTCLWSAPGVGKSSGVLAYCQERGFGLAPFQPAHETSGAGLVGESFIDTTTARTMYAMPRWLPTIEQILSGGMLEQRGIMFIDEVNRAPAAVLQGLLEILQEGRLSKSGWRLPRTGLQGGVGLDGTPIEMQWSVVLAANFADGKNDVTELDEAFMNRCLHIVLEFDIDSWEQFANRRNLADGVTSFALHRAEELLPERITELPDYISIPRTPRSLEHLGCLYEEGMDQKMLKAIAQGLIGKDAAADFMVHIAEYESTNTPQLSADHVVAGAFAGPLAADLAAGRTQHVERVSRDVVAKLSGWKATPDHATNIATYMLRAGGRPAKVMADELQAQAPHWKPLVESAYQQLAAA